MQHEILKKPEVGCLLVPSLAEFSMNNLSKNMRLMAGIMRVVRMMGVMAFVVIDDATGCLLPVLQIQRGFAADIRWRCHQIACRNTQKGNQACKHETNPAYQASHAFLLSLLKELICLL